jgi:DNA-binding LacI/PurR family transcriptional regulator
MLTLLDSCGKLKSLNRSNSMIIKGIKYSEVSIMVTINDVAKEAGVSKSTVSMVINNSPKVKLETKYKVLSVIEKLGYVPNVSAVELTTKRKQNLGMIWFQKYEQKNSFDREPLTYFHDVASGIYSELQNSNYGMLMEEVITYSDTCQIPQFVKTKKVEGVLIVGGVFDHKFIKSIQKNVQHIVILGVDYPNIDSVSTDFKFAVYSGIKYLIEKGHRDILFINGPDITTSTYHKEEGYKLALIEADIPFRKERYRKSPFTGAGGYEAIKDALECGLPLPTAVFAGSDSIACGVLRYLYEKKILIPECVSLMAFCDSILTEYGNPPLTCVNINKKQIGAEGFKLLIQRINNPDSERQRSIIPYKIIERGSVSKIQR